MEENTIHSIMFNNNPHIKIALDSSFNVIESNPAACTFFGFETKEALHAGFSKRLAECIPPEQSNGVISSSFEDDLAKTVECGRLQFETELIVDGKLKVVAVDMMKVPLDDDFVIILFIVDTSLIHELDKEYKVSSEQNKSQLEKLELMMKAAKIGLWEVVVVTDDPLSTDNFFSYSDEFRRLLGFNDEKDFPNLHSSLYNAIHPEDRDRVMQKFAEHILNSTSDDYYDTEYRIMKKNGEYSYYRATGQVVRDSSGSPKRVTGALLDMDEIQSHIDEAERQRNEALAANASKSAFLSTISHEIRTPLNAILGITEIQLLSETISQDVREALEKIYSSGDMLLGIINDILDLSKIEAGKFDLIINKYETASLINDTTTLNMVRIGSKLIDFKLEINENVPANLLGDELRIRQILNNLLSNAFKYTDEGVVTLSINTEANKDNEDELMLIFTVSDTGQGMTKEQVAKLFDEYSQFNKEANRSIEGTGLGMSITTNLIEMMNGTISVESEVGKGSVFTVSIPQGIAGPALIGKELAENLKKFRTNIGLKINKGQIVREPMPYGSVLVVDDVETNIYVANGLLTPYQLNIDSATSGFEAIEKVKSGKVYDIIFMDHMMPKMDGIEAVKHLRDMGYKGTIVALTANAVAGQSNIFLEKGFDDFISKPIDIRQLNLVLNKLIRDKYSKEVIKEARAKHSTAPKAPAIQSSHTDIFKIFRRDALNCLTVLDGILENTSLSGEDILSYRIHVHGMVSVLANVGETDLSAAARKLEHLALDGNSEAILSETPAFIDSLRMFIQKLEKETDDQAQSVDVTEDTSFLKEKLLVIIDACEDWDKDVIKDTLSEIRSKKWSTETNNLLDDISSYLIHSDFDKITDAVKPLL